MTSEVAVFAENISKCFVLQKSRAGDLRELFTGLWQKRERAANADDGFYALRDVGFSIRRGETVGIVGHNGSGKSTLLKMLTGILKPDTGHIRTHGRIGALIEVGAGFHPDLSGRENVYLNGSIMGLSRRELEKKFDEIVSFAGLERFIDTPVKRYSSGMYMRLGFAIATHIEPEILLIDEVLAVGDTQFQNKCIRHLREFAAAGGTVIFVSHAMGQVAELCERCLWLDRGQLLHDGPTTDAVDKYMAVVAEREDEEFKRAHPEEWEAREAAIRQEKDRANEESRRIAQIAAQAGAGSVHHESTKPHHQPNRCRLIAMRIAHSDGRSDHRFIAGQAVKVSIDYELTRPLPCPAFCVEIFRKKDGLHMFTTSNYDHNMRLTGLPKEGTVRFEIPFLSLNEGEYAIRLRLYSDWQVGAWDGVLEDEMEDAATIYVSAGRFAHGCVYLPTHWQATPVTHGESNGLVVRSRRASNVESLPESETGRWEVALQ